MTLYLDACDSCTRCEGCGRNWCPVEEPSPGEADGICDGCWLTSEDGA
jgi:hypothetical protein